jgi:hypothetical protein
VEKVDLPLRRRIVPCQAETTNLRGCLPLPGRPS